MENQIEYTKVKVGNSQNQGTTYGSLEHTKQNNLKK